jgi:hypothetical protein
VSIAGFLLVVDPGRQGVHNGDKMKRVKESLEARARLIERTIPAKKIDAFKFM